MSGYLHAFSLEEKKGILVVTPLGDSVSFRGTHLQADLVEIKKQMKEKGLWKIAVDFGTASYFGSIMIGLINDIGRTAVDNGGHMVMCNASNEMQEIMKVMKISEKWPYVPKLAQAIQVLSVWKD